jgi:hypothetical protein
VHAKGKGELAKQLCHTADLRSGGKVWGEYWMMSLTEDVKILLNTYIEEMDQPGSYLSVLDSGYLLCRASMRGCK